mmetsp:Transcript_9296/g.20931  ORF Transcript_9296/g.20931 Transcript_9296/m.20931 type:complete len:224 (-) Transcript_9296:858-1529(-)
MGKLFVTYMEAEIVQCCAVCGIHLTSHDSIVSKAFQGRHGRAYLYSDVVNVDTGPTENRLLLTGLHVVCDIYCNACDTRLGWKYVEAFEESQKYKVGVVCCVSGLHPLGCFDGNCPAHEGQEGKFILEKAMMIKEEELKRRTAEREARQQRTGAACHSEGEQGVGGDEEDGEDEDDEEPEENDDTQSGQEEDDVEATRQLQQRNTALSAAAQAHVFEASAEGR